MCRSRKCDSIATEWMGRMRRNLFEPNTMCRQCHSHNVWLWLLVGNINRQYNIDNLYLHSMLQTWSAPHLRYSVDAFRTSRWPGMMTCLPEISMRLQSKRLLLFARLFSCVRSICECLTGDTKHEQDEWTNALENWQRLHLRRNLP